MFNLAQRRWIGIDDIRGSVLELIFENITEKYQRIFSNGKRA